MPVVLLAENCDQIFVDLVANFEVGIRVKVALWVDEMREKLRFSVSDVFIVVFTFGGSLNNS